MRTLLGAAGDDVAERSGGLVTDEQNRRLRPIDVVLQVMLDAAGGAHATGGNDDRPLLT